MSCYSCSTAINSLELYLLWATSHLNNMERNKNKMCFYFHINADILFINNWLLNLANKILNYSQGKCFHLGLSYEQNRNRNKTKTNFPSRLQVSLWMCTCCRLLNATISVQLFILRECVDWKMQLSCKLTI